MSSPAQLDETLQAIEAAARELDSGDAAAARRIAVALRAIFHATPAEPSLLSRLGGTFTRIASTLGKATHPDDLFAGLVDVRIHLNLGASQSSTSQETSPVGQDLLFIPLTDRLRDARQVQAPDWWKSEAVFVIDHSRLTRKDLVLWAADAASDPVMDARFARFNEILAHRRAAQGGPGVFYGQDFRLSPRGPVFASLRQMAAEVGRSPELLRLAGRGKK